MERAARRCARAASLTAQPQPQASALGPSASLPHLSSLHIQYTRYGAYTPTVYGDVYGLGGLYGPCIVRGGREA